MVSSHDKLDKTSVSVHVPLLFRIFGIWAVAMLFQPLQGNAQQIIVNTRGEKIVVYPDGSWRYYEAGDSTLVRKKLTRKDVPRTDDAPREPVEKLTGNPDSDVDLSDLSRHFAEQLSQEKEAAQQALARIVADKFNIEAQLQQAEENRNLIEPDFIASLEDAYEASRLKVKTARKELKWIENIAAKADALVAAPIEQKAKKLNKLMARYDAHGVRTDLPEAEAPVAAAPAQPQDRVKDGTTAAKQRTAVPSDERPRNGTVAVEKPSAYQRAPVPCILYNISDSGNSHAGVTVEKGLLFTHTDEDLRPYFRDQELVTCYAALRKVEDNLYLILEFVIASPDARKNFGILDNQSLLRLKLFNGEFVNLFNRRTDMGKLDAYTGNTIYTASYLIDKEAQKSLFRYELDKVRVVWSAGFEDYDIVDVDFLINQYHCLESD